MRPNGRSTAHQHPSPAGPQGARGTGAVSGLLRAWGKGDLEAREQLMPLVYGELRRRAAAYLHRERKAHTLQPTALVHEAYLRLIGQERVVWQNRAHFYGVAAQTMRRILVDHARGHQRDKRCGAAVRVALDDMIGAEQPRDCEMLLLDQALNELAAFDPRQAQIVELRYFAGLSEGEIADLLAVSRSTVTREWVVAKGWLFRRITTGAGAAQVSREECRPPAPRPRRRQDRDRGREHGTTRSRSRETARAGDCRRRRGRSTRGCVRVQGLGVAGESCS